MKNTFKKIVASAMAVAAAAVSIVGMGTNAIGDYTNSDYSFSVTTDEWLNAGYTIGRQKYNNSSVYVRLDTTGKSIYTQTQGTYVYSSHWVNNTSRGRVTLTSGRWEIYNNIFETYVESGKYGQAYARLKMWAANSNSSGSISGAWSPDCSGSYPVAN